MEIPASAGANGIVIHVRLTPKSGAEKIAGVELHGEKPVLKAHVTAPPEDGKANAALILLIARWLGVPKSKVTMAAGQKSRLKSVSVAGDAEDLMQRLGKLLAEPAGPRPNSKR
ncbi:MAG: DUF167 family protein [Rhodomicrobium sp.]